MHTIQLDETTIPGHNKELTSRKFPIIILKSLSQASYFNHIHSFSLNGVRNLRLIDTIISSLIDGNWHSIDEILEYLGDTKPKTLFTLMFLWKFDFVDVDQNEKHIKLSYPFANFMTNIKKIDKSCDQDF